MSLTIIDHQTYTSLLTSTISAKIKRGIPRQQAIKDAHYLMRNSFICSDYAKQVELEKDLQDERQSDWTR